MEIISEREQKGLKDKEGVAGQVLAGNVNKWEHGSKVQFEVTGREVKGGMMAFAPTIDSYLKEHLFADIFARGVLSYQDREIATIAALFTLNGVEIQLNSHINIGKHNGLSQNQIDEIALLVKEEVKLIAPIFAKGEPNPYSKFFTGQTYLTMLNVNDDIFKTPIANVTFEPSARTYWHKHSGGQILLITEGEGRYQEEEREKQILKKGDVVKIAPNVIHWHGAAPNAWFAAHISVETNVPNNQVTWLEPVTSEQYK